MSSSNKVAKISRCCMEKGPQLRRVTLTINISFADQTILDL